MVMKGDTLMDSSNTPIPNERTALRELISQALSTLAQETQSDDDTNYKPLYYGLFNGISLIIENVETLDQTIASLKYLQQMAENAYIIQEK